MLMQFHGLGHKCHDREYSLGFVIFWGEMSFRGKFLYGERSVHGVVNFLIRLGRGLRIRFALVGGRKRLAQVCSSRFFLGIL